MSKTTSNKKLKNFLHGYLLMFVISFLTCNSSTSIGQTRTYQLSSKTDSIIQLLSRDVAASEIAKVYGNIKNEESVRKINRLKRQLSQVEGDESLELQLNLQIGREARRGESDTDGYQFFARSLYLAEKLKDENAIAIACFEMANAIRLGSIRDRPYQSYFQRAIEIFESQKDPLSISYLLYAKLLQAEDDDLKLRYAEDAVKVLELSLDRSDTLIMESLARHYNVIGLYQTGDQKTETFEKGLTVAKEVGDYMLQAFILNNIGYEFLLKKDYDRAIPYHLEALDVSIKAGIKSLASNSLNNLAACYRNKGMYKEALYYYHGFFSIQVNYNSDGYFQSLAQIQSSNNLDRVTLSNELLISEQKLQAKQRLILIIVLFLLLLVVGFVYWSRRKVAKTNEKLKALDKVKTRFFANISHELRTPLTLINAPLESLIHDGKIKDPEVIEALETAIRNGVNLHSLVEEILDLAKLDGGKLKLVENPVRVKNFLQLLLSDYKSGFDRKSISIDFKFYPKEELAILIDENRCTKIINNLLSNALKFTPQNGTIQVVVDEDIEENTLSIKVKDSGIGIHPDDLPFIFDRYYQSERPDKKAEGGTGIGLALAKELANLQRGKLHVESIVDKGTTFNLVLPIKEVFEETIVLPVAFESKELEIALNETISSYKAKFDLDKPVLLVTEDHPEMRAFIAKTLMPYFEIKQAENGKVALEILRSTRIDIVISDVMMPIMDGFELLEAIKRDKSLHQVSLIMLTARADHDDKLYALTLGIDDYLTKPFSASEFLARIKNILENRIKIIRKLDESNEHYEISDLAELYGLVDREVEVLQLLAKRYSNQEIADDLFISRNTVKFHIKNIYGKMGIKTRQEAEEKVNQN